jgi:hypothetical protein
MYFKTLFLLLTVFVNALLYTQENNLEPLHQVHSSLFDLYFPEMAFFDSNERMSRSDWKNKTWLMVKNNELLLSLLKKLDTPEAFPQEVLRAFPVLYDGFSNLTAPEQEKVLLMLARHSDNDIRFYASQLRKTYTALAYANPLTNNIAHVPSTQRVIHDVDIELPESRLKINDTNIIHQDGPIDYLIIGTGPAGSLIAHELTRLKQDCRIVIIDAGSFIKPGSIKTESDSELMESNNRRTTKTGGIALRNGSVVGGGTTVNLDLAFSPLSIWVRNRLQQGIDSSCIKQELCGDASNDWAQLRDAYDWVTQKVMTRSVEDWEINTNNRILFNGTDSSHTYSLNEKKPNGDGQEVLKISAVDAFLVPALQQKGVFESSLSLIPDVKVTTILFNEDQDSRKAYAVEVEFQAPLEQEYCVKDLNSFGVMPGVRAVIEAKNIILSAGTLGSAEILLRSNIDNDAIGRGIVLHPSMAVFARFPYEVNALSGLSASVFAASEDDSYFFESMAADPFFVALLHSGSGSQIITTLASFNNLGGFGIMLIDTVNSDNRIIVDPKTNAVEVDYTMDEDDKVKLKDALKKALEIIFAQGALEVFLPSCEPFLSQDLAYHSITSMDQIDQVISNIKFIENETIFSSAHMQGSNKMGPNPETSVVSLNFRVWDRKNRREIPNLYVVDSSVFPASVGANPMQSIYSMAKLFVDQVI